MLFALLAAAVIAPPDPIVGRATVIDGDTIEIRGQRIRLWGIDAPEGRQTCTRSGETYRCGQDAANALHLALREKTVTCVPEGRPDRYGRIVAKCTAPWPNMTRAGRVFGWSPADVGRHMVVSGHALDYPRYSQRAYADVQEMAQRTRRGMWAGEFQRPWEWRAR